MFDPTKTDPKLGYAIETRLKHLGIQTPTTEFLASDAEEKIKTITQHFEHIIRTVGLDLQDDSISGTPKRLATMMVNETMWGLSPANFPRMMTVDNKMQYDEMLVERNISVMSLCEHHLVVFNGHCHLGYIPNGKVVGLSKFNRVVEYFSRRPQVQERLTAQIFETLKYLLDTENVAVMIDCDHYCVISRGVEDQNSSTVTSKLGGVFREHHVKAEFLSLVNAKNNKR